VAQYLFKNQYQVLALAPKNHDLTQMRGVWDDIRIALSITSI